MITSLGRFSDEGRSSRATSLLLGASRYLLCLTVPLNLVLGFFAVRHEVQHRPHAARPQSSKPSGPPRTGGPAACEQALREIRSEVGRTDQNLLNYATPDEQYLRSFRNRDLERAVLEHLPRRASDKLARSRGNALTCRGQLCEAIFRQAGAQMGWLREIKQQTFFSSVKAEWPVSEPRADLDALGKENVLLTRVMLSVAARSGVVTQP